MWDRVGDEGDHVGKESVRGNVEGDAETEVGGTLVHDTGEEVERVWWRRGRGQGYVELTEHVTGW